MKVSSKISCVLMSIFLCAGPLQSAVAADESTEVVSSNVITATNEEQIIVYPDDSKLIIKEKKVATKEDFPVIPEVGKKVKLKYPDKEMEIQTLAAGCTVSFSAYTPYKWDNRGRL